MSRATPLYFGPDQRPLFGWLHRAPASRGLGMVVCNPFGFEEVCAHRSLRHFAEVAAEAGIPTLRFDYDGTGDSAGEDRDPGRLEAWIASVGQAITTLRARAGVERVVLLGVRLGALVAALAASRRDDIDGLIAIAPVVIGKAHLRELRALQMALNLREPPPDAVVDKEVQEVIGFLLSAETKAALTAVNLTQLETPPAPGVLLIERDDMPANDAWPDRLTSQGVTVDRQRLPGYVEMMLAPDRAIVPDAMVRAAAVWLSARAPRPAARTSRPSMPPPPSYEPDTAPRTAKVTPGVVESSRFVAGRLFGVLATPESPPKARRGLLLLSAGAVHRIGPNRLHVALARRWAALGHAVLRLDIAGIGDSPPVPGEPENVVYSEGARNDIAQALAFLREQSGVTEVHALGICSGGYHAFKAAVAEVPLDGVLLINPLIFFFKPNLTTVDAAAHEVTLESTARRALNPETWKRALRGEVNVRGVTRVMARRIALMTRDRVRDLARRAGVRTTDDLAKELELVTSKKIVLRFLFTAGDPGITLLSNQGGAMVDRLRREDALGFAIIEGPDHTFTPLWSHRVLESTLAAYFDGPPAALPPRSETTNTPTRSHSR